MARNSANLSSAFANTLQRWDFKMEKTQTDLIKVLEKFNPKLRNQLNYN